MQCFTELLPPTGVTHALVACFLSPASENLIVAKTSLLQVFKLSGPGAKNYLVREHQEPKVHQNTHLVLVCEYSLSGIISGLEKLRVPNSKSGGEVVLVSLRDAKLSLIEWDPINHGISTISIHYYERDDLGLGPWAPKPGEFPTCLAVDPSSRCAILSFAKQRIAVIPFHQAEDDLLDDYDVSDRWRKTSGSPVPDTSIVHLNGNRLDTPYLPSFILPVTALEPAIIHPVSFTFLFEYREPTFGILYSHSEASSLLSGRKDSMSYSVITLHLEQKASTTLLSVTRLPNDLFSVTPLPLPVGGALLVGANELLHVDQAGKVNAVGVNGFFSAFLPFPINDQSDLNFHLEGCIVQRLGTDSGDMLLVTSDGQSGIIQFMLDGRSMSGISVRNISDDIGGSLIRRTAPLSCSELVCAGKMFLGSEISESILIGWSEPSKPSRLQAVRGTKHDMIDSDDEDEAGDNGFYDDDLYSNPAHNSSQSSDYQAQESSYAFYPLDTLFNVAPLSDFALGRPFDTYSDNSYRMRQTVAPDLEMVATNSSSHAAGLIVMRRRLQPTVMESTNINGANGVWTIHVQDKSNGSQAFSSSLTSDNNYHQYLIISCSNRAEGEESIVYRISGLRLEKIKTPEFNQNGDFTIDIEPLGKGSRIIQVLKSEIRSYDSYFGLSQIYPISDEDTGDNRTVAQASFADPYLFILRDDGSVLLLRADDTGDLDEVPTGETITSVPWVSGSLYRDETHTFIPNQQNSTNQLFDNFLMFLLGQNGIISIYHLPELCIPIYTVGGIDLLLQNLSSGLPLRRQGLKENIAEILVADLGDSTQATPYLILRSANNDVTIYEPYFTYDASPDSKPNLRFLKNDSKLSGQPKPIFNDTRVSRNLCRLGNIGGYRLVFLPGFNPCFIVKTATSLPHVLGLQGSRVYSISGFHSSTCKNGFVYVDTEGSVRICSLPDNIFLGLPWTIQKVQLQEQVDKIIYSASSHTYVLGCNQLSEFKLPHDDELHPEWQHEVITSLPRVDTGCVKLLNPRTWSIIDNYEFGQYERVMCMQCLDLEISEGSHQRKNLVVVGSSIVKGEDVMTRGCLYIFEVVNTVPDPNILEASHKLKLLTREEVKGAVTSLSAVGGQGFLLVSQGQKCMVRGLKEDGSLLPVAFMDMQFYTSVLKELKGTGLCLMGDALKGFWFVGYSEEPYKLTLFGKETDDIPVLAADFLPDGRRLYFLTADDNCNIYVFQYDPEDPSSSNGDRLLRRSTFHAGHTISDITLLPRVTARSDIITAKMSNTADFSYQALITFRTGSIGLITPLAEDSYRRLSALQSQLANNLEHPCGLNPKAHRSVESDAVGGRGIIDGTLIFKWLRLSTLKRGDLASRIGSDAWEVLNDIETISYDGLEYF